MVCTCFIALGNNFKRCRQKCLLNHRHAPCIPSQGGFQSPVEKILASNKKDKGMTAYLLDVRNVWCEALRDLWNDFLDQSLVFHRLSGFHDSKTAERRIKKSDPEGRVKTRMLTYRTIVAWITYLRSSSTAFRTSADSALTSALIGKFKLTRIFFDLKSNPKQHEDEFS